MVKCITGCPELVAGEFPGSVVDVSLPFLAQVLKGLLFDWVGGAEEVSWGVGGGSGGGSGAVELVKGPLEIEWHDVGDKPGDALSMEDDF